MRCHLDQIRRVSDIWKAHTRSVVKLEWNSFHKHIFISAGDDWMLKLWDQRRFKDGPIKTFDVRSPIHDVQFAPHSSTIFAACLRNGRVLVFDLSMSMDRPICVQVMNRARSAVMLSLAFNPFYPILLSGDSNGKVMSFKLSPNLRRCCATNNMNTILFEKNKTNIAVTTVKKGKGKRDEGGEDSPKAASRHKADEEKEKIELIAQTALEVDRN